MLQIRQIIILLFSLTLAAPVWASSLHYKIIVDAGSSGSRLHLFQYDDNSALPEVHDIYSANVKPGLSSYADNPAAAGPALALLFSGAADYLAANNIPVASVEANVLATAGMRLLTEKQQHDIYASVTTYLTTHYSFPLGKIETISGQMEGLYGWLDINYMQGNFETHKSTVGNIDMGGASTEITFATLDQTHQDDEINLTVNNQRYTVFSKSFLKLGLNEARNTMGNYPLALDCYPKDYQFQAGMAGDFNFAACQQIYSNVIEQQNVSQQILANDGQTFIAHDGVYGIYHFFNVDQTADQGSLEQAIHNVCGLAWSDMQKHYPDEKYLATDCADASYLDDLLYANYHLSGNQLKVVSQINQQDISWTLGALLYSLIGSK